MMLRHARAIMRLLTAGTAVSGLVLAMGTVPAGGAARQHAAARVAPRVDGTWGMAVEVPGLAALNPFYVGLISVSCASAGNCSAVGTYEVVSGTYGWVATQSNGTWGDAIQIPGLAALDVDHRAEVSSVSCGAVGNCSAGGSYIDGSGHTQAWVASESNGVWGNAVEVPGLAALNTLGAAGVGPVSCASAGDCSAGGFYNDLLGFVVSERNGVWGNAVRVSGRTGPIGTMSCASAGNCSAGGTYRNGEPFEGFVLSQSKGTWGKATNVPGLGALNTGGNANVVSVSCASAGNCSAGGVYNNITTFLQGFVVTESGGRWGKAIEVPGLGALNTGGDAEVNSVSCASAGNCSAGGIYTDNSVPTNREGFVVSETNGVWHTATDVPGLAALNTTGDAAVESVSCASAGNCSAGGFYRDGSGTQGFVVSESNGVWHTAIDVPGLGALNVGEYAGVGAVSCASAGRCSVGGGYTDSRGHFQGFVASKS